MKDDVADELVDDDDALPLVVDMMSSIFTDSTDLSPRGMCVCVCDAVDGWRAA